MASVAPEVVVEGTAVAAPVTGGDAVVAGTVVSGGDSVGHPALLSLPPGVGRGIQMRKRILNLSTSGSSSGGMGCTIAVKVVDQDGREAAYIVEMDNSLAPMMDQYCHTRGIGDSSRSTLRFLFDGERVNSHQTPRMLELEDGDCIDVMTEQLGGVE